MIQSIQLVAPYLVIASQLFLIVILLSKDLQEFIGKRALWFGFKVSLLALLGSLFYSDLVGFEPCLLCWWQRVFLYPQVVLFGIALWKKDLGVFKYSLPLTVLAGILAFYQSYVYAGGKSLLPCTAAEGSCSKVYVYEFGGLVTIPSMSLTVVLYLLLIYWLYKKNENRNA